MIGKSKENWKRDEEKQAEKETKKKNKHIFVSKFH